MPLSDLCCDAQSLLTKLTQEPRSSRSPPAYGPVPFGRDIISINTSLHFAAISYLYVCVHPMRLSAHTPLSITVINMVRSFGGILFFNSLKRHP